jgi:hypothetical protein
MLQSRLPTDILDGILWSLQALVLILAWRAGRRTGEEPEPSLTPERCLIAILVAWIWRLIYLFVLSSRGFAYLVPDDVARWLLSWGWSVSPYLISWDGIWQGGTFYVHGAAMALLRDPLVASKFVAAFSNLLPLIGIFVLTQGLYRSSRLSAVAVVAAAPWWLPILLGTGAMTETPVTGLFLTGVGLLLIALDERTADRASGRALIGAALFFFASTAYHLLAWMMLVSFLLVFARRLLTSPKAAVRRRLPLFLVVSFAYCVVWSLGCWIKFGSPLAFLTAYDANNLKHGLRLSMALRARAFPLAFLYDAWLFLPALGVGVIAAFGKGDETRRRERLVIGGAVASLALLTTAAIIGSAPNTRPERNALVVVSACFPIAVAALARAWMSEARPFRPSGSGRSSVVVLSLALAWVAVNHARTFERVRSQQTLDPDAVATGTWLREALGQPDADGRFPPEDVVHVWVAPSTAYPDYSILYLFGSPARTRHHQAAETEEEVLSSVAPGEWLVTDRPLTPSDLETVRRIGKYQLFRRTDSSSDRRIQPPP